MYNNLKKILIPAFLLTCLYNVSYATDNTDGSITFVNQCTKNLTNLVIYSHMAAGRCHAYAHGIGTIYSNTRYQLPNLNDNCNFYSLYTFGSHIHFHETQEPLYDNHSTSLIVTYTNNPAKNGECTAQITAQ